MLAAHFFRNGPSDLVRIEDEPAAPLFKFGARAEVRQGSLFPFLSCVRPF